HHRLGAAVAEALLHHALLDARTLERQGRLRRSDGQFLAGMLRFSHSIPNFGAFGSAWLSFGLSGSAARTRARIRQRAMTVSVARPASRAACITFGRASAKSNWADVNAGMTTTFAVSAADPRRIAAMICRTPSGPASRART